MNFNQTAYRILMLVQWLYERPLTFDEISQRFAIDPKIRKTLSQDTFWLYLNTLKGLGCEISRPTRRNGFCYELLDHPFRYFLTPADIEVIKKTIAQMEDVLEFWDAVRFHQFISQVFQACSNKNRDSLANRFYCETRGTDFEALENRILELERHCLTQSLLYIHYSLPNEPCRVITLLPQRLFMHQGLAYVLGQTEERESASMLRIDRIQSVLTTENEKLRQKLINRQRQTQCYVLRLINCTPEQLESLGESQEIAPDPEADTNLLMRIFTDNEFLLKQKLLASGIPFQVLYPQRFRQEILAELSEMKALYAHV